MVEGCGWRRGQGCDGAVRGEEGRKRGERHSDRTLGGETHSGSNLHLHQRNLCREDGIIMNYSLHISNVLAVYHNSVRLRSLTLFIHI